MEKGMASACRDYLVKHGLKISIAFADEDDTFRVLVGPMKDGQIPSIRKELAELRFRTQLRHY
jgi:hypothetical protein